MYLNNAVAVFVNDFTESMLKNRGKCIETVKLPVVVFSTVQNKYRPHARGYLAVYFLSN